MRIDLRYGRQQPDNAEPDPEHLKERECTLELLLVAEAS